MFDAFRDHYAAIGRLLTGWSHMVITMENAIILIERHKGSPPASPGRRVMQRFDHLIRLYSASGLDAVELRKIKGMRNRLIEVKKLRDALSHGFVFAWPEESTEPDIVAFIDDGIVCSQKYGRSLAEAADDSQFISHLCVRIANAAGTVVYGRKQA